MQQTTQAADPTSSVAVDVNASVAESDLDVIQSNLDGALNASIGLPTDASSSSGNVYERLNYLDLRLDTNVGNDLGDINAARRLGSVHSRNSSNVEESICKRIRRHRSNEYVWHCR